mmetsp:Transcript_53931/g.135552  ORF Transcript_53931/g.135552 Transcript_53931/m.135552 type:complete len:96 (+) Transcript_53931:337-624(+)
MPMHAGERVKRPRNAAASCACGGWGGGLVFKPTRIVSVFTFPILLLLLQLSGLMYFMNLVQPQLAGLLHVSVGCVRAVRLRGCGSYKRGLPCVCI